jgi:hypothetical protein
VETDGWAWYKKKNNEKSSTSQQSGTSWKNTVNDNIRNDNKQWGGEDESKLYNWYIEIGREIDLISLGEFFRILANELGQSSFACELHLHLILWTGLKKFEMEALSKRWSMIADEPDILSDLGLKKLCSTEGLSTSFTTNMENWYSGIHISPVPPNMMLTPFNREIFLETTSQTCSRIQLNWNE